MDYDSGQYYDCSRIAGEDHDMAQQYTHESFAREEEIAVGSDRSFGIVMATVLALLSVLNWWRGGTVWPWLGLTSIVLAIVAHLYAPALKPVNRLWFKFGLLLHAVINPIVMGVLFYFAVLPTGLIMRAMGKDMLRLRREPKSGSYWIVRQPPGPPPETMKDQF
jgi:hypothetical protein